MNDREARATYTIRASWEGGSEFWNPLTEGFKVNVKLDEEGFSKRILPLQGVHGC